MTAFADTFALIAWLNPRDSAHAIVAAYLGGFTGRLLTTNGYEKTSMGTWWQRFVASNIPFWAWFVAGQLIGFAVLFDFVQPSLPSTTDLWFCLLAIVCVPLTVAISFFGSILMAHIVLGPFFHFQGLANGGPFQIGDRVCVLAGPHAGRESRVYELWQHDTVRIRLGPEDENNFRDIFSSYQLLRLSSDEPKHAPKPASEENGIPLVN